MALGKGDTSSSVHSFRLTVPPRVTCTSPGTVATLFQAGTALGFVRASDKDTAATGMIIATRSRRRHAFSTGGNLGLRRSACRITLANLAPNMACGTALATRGSTNAAALSPLAFAPMSSRAPHVFCVKRADDNGRSNASFSGATSSVGSVTSRLVTINSRVHLLRNNVSFNGTVALSGLPNLAVINNCSGGNGVMNAASVAGGPTLGSARHLFCTRGSALAFGGVGFLGNYICGGGTGFGNGTLCLSGYRAAVRGYAFGNGDEVGSVSNGNP